MAEIKWIKMSTDLFNNRKIKQIRKLPDGDSIIGIWLQILCLAGDVNNGGLIYFAKDVPYTDEMLSTEFDRPINVIRLALTTFERFSMMEIIDDVLCVSNWEKYQNQDKLETIKEYNRVKKREYRLKQQERLSETCQGQVLGSPQTDIYSISNSISNKDISNKVIKNIYGTYKNVKLTKEEYQKLINEYGEIKTDKAIDFLSYHREEKGYKNKSDYLSIRRWVVKAVEEKQITSGNPFKDKLKEAIENEQRLNDRGGKESNGNHVGYKGGLSKLLQEPNGD